MQKTVSEFIEKYHLHTDAQTRYIDLASEIGELGKELIKATDYGKKTYESTTGVSDEMGDCLFSLLALCCELNVDAHDALDAALRKYEMRFFQNGHVGSGR